MTKEEEESILEAFPSNWLDPMLTGPHAVLGKPPWGCPDVERLVAAIKDRVIVAMNK